MKGTARHFARPRNDTSDEYKFKPDFWKTRQNQLKERKTLLDSIVNDDDIDDEEHDEDVDPLVEAENRRLGSLDQQQYAYLEDLRKLRDAPENNKSELSRVHANGHA